MATKKENPAAETVEKVKKTAEKAAEGTKKTAEKAVEEVKDTAKKAKTATKEIVQGTTAGGKKVEHNITHVEAQSTNAEELQNITKGNATPYRILASASPPFCPA